MAKDNYQSLLYKLKSLYTRIFLVSLHNRIHSYHPVTHTNIHPDMNGFLYKLIDEIVNEVSNTYSPDDYQHLKFLDDKNHQNPVRATPAPRTTTMVSMTLNGLSLYLQNQNVVEFDQRMSEKLTRCFWDHVHSAHRFARFGDAKTAKLHADIASNAMKSLSQYMPSDEYQAFITEFTSELSTEVSANTVASSEST